MNFIQNVIDRQLGLACRFNYDHILRRLVVREDESFYGLQAGAAAAAASLDQDPPIFACRFAEASGYEHILALANEDGRVAIQDTTTAASANQIESFQCHNNAVFDLAWMPGQRNFVTVSGDHTACLWDVSEGAPKRVVVFSGHTKSVKTAVFRPSESCVFATGARDGHVMIWDTRVNSQVSVVTKADNSLLSCHSQFVARTAGSHGKRPRLATQRAGSVTGLAFQDAHTLLSCGESDGNIKVWDLRKNYSGCRRSPLPKYSLPYGGASVRCGYTHLLVDAPRARLYAACMDHVVYRYHLAAAAPDQRYVGHESRTFYIKLALSPDGEYLVSGSSDRYAYVWDVRASAAALRLRGHGAEVTCAAWRRAPACAALLATCGDDARHCLWRLGPEHLPLAERHQYRGHAEPVPHCDRMPPWGARHTTPRAAKRPASPRTPAADTPCTPAADTASTPARRSKRCLLELQNDPATSRLELDRAAKRPKLDPQPLHDGAGCLARRDDASPPPSPPPTKDLPDWVRDGAAPHLRLMSPRKRRADAPDWLTRMRRDKRARPHPHPAPASPPPAPPAPPRRASASERPPRASRHTRTLLEYFAVAGKQKC